MTIHSNEMMAYTYVEKLLDAIDVLNDAIDGIESFGADGINKECAMSNDNDIEEIDAHLNTALSYLQDASFVVEDIMNHLKL